MLLEIFQGKLPKLFNIEVSEPLKDHKESTSKKCVVPQMLIRTDFNEQKLDKFFLDNKNSIKEERNSLDDSLRDVEYVEKHELFLKHVENLEDKIMNSSENDITMKNDDGRYSFYCI